MCLCLPRVNFYDTEVWKLNTVLSVDKLKQDSGLWDVCVASNWQGDIFKGGGGVLTHPVTPYFDF